MFVSSAEAPHSRRARPGSRAACDVVTSSGASPGATYALLLFATIRGIAALVTSGIVGPEAIGELLDDAVTTFIRGSAAR